MQSWGKIQVNTNTVGTVTLPTSYDVGNYSISLALKVAKHDTRVTADSEILTQDAVAFSFWCGSYQNPIWEYLTLGY